MPVSMLVRCEKCGYENFPQHRFCGMCAAELRLPGPGGSPAPPARVSPPAAAAPVRAAVRTVPLQKTAPPPGAVPPPRKVEPVSQPVDGPSSLGLTKDASESRSLSYLLEDEEEPQHRGRNVALFVLIVAIAAAGWYWRQDLRVAASRFLSGPPPAASANGNGAQDASSSPASSPAEATSANRVSTTSQAVPAPAGQIGNQSPMAQPQTPPAQPQTPPASAESPASGSNPAPQANPVQSGRPPADQSTADQSTADQSSANQSPGDQPQAGQSGADQSSAGQSQSDQAQASPAQGDQAKPSDQSQAADSGSASAAPKSDNSTRTAASAPAPARKSVKTQAHPAVEDLEAEGEKYLYGNGVPENCTRARTNLLAAAKGSSAQAQSVLGTMYATGHCATRDLPTAYRWFSRSLRKDPNNTRLEDDLKVLWNQMTPEERRLALSDER